MTTKPSNNNDGTPKEIATTNGSCICKANDLIWSDHPKVSCEFRKKVIKICQDMWPNDYLAMANNLMACMYFETATTFDPSKGNGSGYYGLIQFGTLACKDLNTTTDKIRAMSAIEQLDWVKKYFKLRNRHELIKNLVHMYLCINYPTNLIQKKTGPHDILYDYTQPAYISNPSFFKENGEKDRFKIINDKKKYLGFKDGKTYVWEVAEELNIYYKRGEKPENRKFTPTCSQVVQLPTQPADSLKLNPLACGGDKHYKRTLDNINSLHPIMRPYVIKLINEGYQKTGLNWMITDAYRSPKKQGEIPGANTNAGPMQSYHQYGLAIDIVSVTNGEITYTRDGGKSRAMNNLSITHSKKLGPIGVSLGLEWGGNWTKTKDYPHFELKPNGKTWKDLRPILINIGIENYKNLTFD
ncbi:M15 family metallopeptidase [Psychrobacter sp. FME5]|uniref:M15 family metallopeptidase n=2 Tax=unclassified Psychrobacter TaxID=196806 RepID=UPI00298EDA87|nr:M15 family metallopeptidase [Psychrobacter sp. FME5]